MLKKELVENYLYTSQLSLQALQIEGKFSSIYHNLEDRNAAASGIDLTEMQNLVKLYDFSNLHVFNVHHHQLFSTESARYPEGLLNKIDVAISRDPKRIRLIDASAESKDNQTLLFFYMPIQRGDSVVAEILVQENFQKIQRILLENTGLGNSGESYIVGENFRLRSTSRFFPDSLPGLIKVETEAVKNLFQGKDGHGIIKDYRGVSVLSAYRKIDIADLHWAIISEMDEEEAMQPILILRNYFIVLTAGITILIILVTYLFSNAIIKPVLQLQDAVLVLSKGMIPPRSNVSVPSDEIGEMAAAIQTLAEGLERTATFANEIGSGHFNTSFTTLSDRDALGSALIKMRDELREFHEMELKSARARAAALLEGQEMERARIIKDLHDGVGQMLTAVRMQIDAAVMDDARKTQIKAYLNDVISEVKRISYHVMPQAIIDFGLEAALRGLCESIKRYSSLTIDFSYISESRKRLDFEVSIALYRIVQEGMNNIIKHAAAAEVTLYLLEKEDELYCVLEDDGRGFPTSDIVTSPGSGLKNIRERIMLLNGTLEISSSPGHGTTLEIHIPRT